MLGIILFLLNNLLLKSIVRILTLNVYGRIIINTFFFNFIIKNKYNKHHIFIFALYCKY